MLCEYNKIFGEPRKGVHKYRLFDFAIIDIIFTVLFAYFINKYMNINNFTLVFIILIIFAIIFHKIFCVRTKLNQIIFDN